MGGYRAGDHANGVRQLSERVLSTDRAKSAAQQMSSLLNGSLRAQLAALKQQGQALCSPAVWDGPAAARFRSQQWPPMNLSMDQAFQVLASLEKSAQTVVDNIMRAGSGGPLRLLQAEMALLDAGELLAGVLDPSMIPPVGTDPAEANAWWKGLSPAQQAGLIQEFPAQIGALDGVPAVARDEANRISLAADKLQLQGQLAGLDAHEPPATVTGYGRQVANPAWQQWHDQVTVIKGKLAGISSVESGLALGGQKGYPTAFLLGFDTNGNGHAIVSFGNPDTAHNTVTYVPGLGSKLAGAFGDSRRAAVLWKRAYGLDPTAKTASIYWLNYNAPQWSLSSVLSTQSVALSGDARAGAPALDRFAAGLAAAHIGSPAHTVMLGHSYGSLVVGEAATRAPGHLATDLAFVGSPGVTVSRASQLGVPAAHVYAGEASNDPVAHLGQFGTDPASVGFGGKTFAVGAGSLWPLFKAHSQYWDPKSVSLLNLAHIVDGQYSQVTPGQLVIEGPVPGLPPGFPWIGPVHT